jgi:hypothetical protein
MLNVPATINQAVAAVAGFTSPTFTTVQSSTTVPNGKQYSVTARGGTQPGGLTDVNSASRPFSFLATRPATIQQLPALNAAGVLPNVPVNVYTLGTRKGLTVLSGQPSVPGYVKSSFGIPAGADLADANAVAAMLVAHAMAIAQMAQGIIDTAQSGEI